MLHHQQEALEDRARIAVEQGFVGRLEQLAAHLKALVQRTRRRGRLRGEQRLEVLQQDRIELRDGFRRAVIPLHQALAGTPLLVAAQPALLCQRVLMIERHAILAPAGKVVQPDAQVLQDFLMAHQLQGFIAHDQPFALQVAPVVTDSERARDPPDDLQVTHSSRGFLEVRLEGVGRVLVLGVALLLLETLGLEERRGVEDFAHRGVETPKQRLAARQRARFEQRRLHGDVCARCIDARFDRPHAVPGFEADIPEQADEALEALLVVARGLVGEQDQQVDVGTRKKLASPVSAGRDQCGFGRGRGLAPDFLQRAVDQPRMLAQQTRGSEPRHEPFAQRAPALLQQRAPALLRGNGLVHAAQCAR